MIKGDDVISRPACREVASQVQGEAPPTRGSGRLIKTAGQGGYNRACHHETTHRRREGIKEERENNERGSQRKEECFYGNHKIIMGFRGVGMCSSGYRLT